MALQRRAVDTALAGTDGAAAPLPHLERIQAAFGRHELGHVRSAVGGEAGATAARLGARAFTVGDRIAFRDEPDLRLAAHEAAHIVQQRSGLALEDDVGRPGDMYERQADAAADAVVAGRSAEALLDAPRASTPAPAVQLAGMGDVRAAEAEAERSAGHASGSADEIEAKFFRLAEMYPNYPFPNFSGPRDLDDYMVSHPGKIDTFGGPYDFNVWVMKNQALMHPVMLAKRLHPVLTAERYTGYAKQHIALHLTFTYPNRSYKFWAGRLLSPGYLRYDWQGGSSADTQPTFERDFMNEWRAKVRLGDKGHYSVWCRISIGGSSRVENSMTAILDHDILVVGTREDFASEALEKAATQPDVEGNDPLFEKGSGGHFYRKPGATALTLEQMIIVNNIKMGALKALRQQGKISERDYLEVRGYFERRNKGLSEARLPSSNVYLLSGAFVSDEYPETVPIRAVMANNLPNRGRELRVVLQDVTLDPKVPTKHEGAAAKPEGDVNHASWLETERRAILAMADHWKSNNDYPHGRVTLYVGSALDQTVTLTVIIPQQNWKKTLRSILAPVALVAAVGALLVGQVEIAVPLMYVGTAAGLANIALGIEHRIQMGTFGFDGALLLDVLQVVTMFLGVGAMSQAFQSFSYAGKVFYLVGMGAADVTQGILLAADAQQQIADLRAAYKEKLSRATTDEERRALQQQYEAAVAEVIGAAIVSGSFIAVSTAAGARGIKQLPKPAGVPIEGFPVRPPGPPDQPVPPPAATPPATPKAEPVHPAGPAKPAPVGPGAPAKPAPVDPGAPAPAVTQEVVQKPAAVEQTTPPKPPAKPGARETVEQFQQRGGKVVKVPPAKPSGRGEVTAAPKSQLEPPEGFEDIFAYGDASVRKASQGRRGEDIWAPENPKTAAGTFAHNRESILRDPSVLTDMMKRASVGKRGIFSEPIPAGAKPEVTVPHPDYPAGMKPRIDRLIDRDGMIIEIKPKHLKAQGDVEARQYAEWMDKYDPLPPPRKWRWKTVTYDQKKLLKYLKAIGFFE
jgi:hypothetical protein